MATTNYNYKEHNWILRGKASLTTRQTCPEYPALSTCFSSPSCGIHWFHLSLN